MECNICSAEFTGAGKVLYLCAWKKGFVHEDCCINLCSWDHTPCRHRLATYVKHG